MAFSTIRRATDEDIEAVQNAADRFRKRHKLDDDIDLDWLDYMHEKSLARLWQ